MTAGGQDEGAGDGGADEATGARDGGAPGDDGADTEDGGADAGTADPGVVDDLVAGVLDGEHRALARAITKIENRAPGYRDIVTRLHAHTGSASVVGVTGSPGAGKSTLVDKLARAYRDRGETVGVVAVDPASPYTGGAVLGDRIRMGSNVGDMDVFFRSMSARGTLGGLSTTTADAVTALDAFGKDRIVVETVGAGQNEVDIVRTAETVVVLVPPGSGDDVQMLKAGILEIADLLVVNKADLDGADRTVRELREMVATRGDGTESRGHHGPGAAAAGRTEGDTGDGPPGNRTGPGGRGAGDDEWTPPILETVADRGEGVDAVLDALAEHRRFLERTGRLTARARTRYAESIRALLREDLQDLLVEELDARGGLAAYVDAVVARETDPYSVADEVIAPVADCVRERRQDDE